MTSIPSTSPAGPKPVDCPHTCYICGKKLRKNKDSYHGNFAAEMVQAIRRAKPAFSVKHDICKECGEKYFNEVGATLKKKPWMLRPLG